MYRKRQTNSTYPGLPNPFLGLSPLAPLCKGGWEEQSFDGVEGELGVIIH